MTEQKSVFTNVELTPQDFNIASILLAEAFFDNSPHIYIFPNHLTRLKALRWGLKTYLALNLGGSNPIGKSFALVEANKSPGIRKIKAMAFWRPPNSGSASFISQVKTGWLTIPFRYGWKTWQRMSEITDAMEKVKDKVIGDRQSWYLNNMVVAKNVRGTGVGTKLLKDQLQSVVVPSGFPAVLMTQKEENVKFYQRLGFEIAHKSDLGSGKNAFTNWCLIFSN